MNCNLCSSAITERNKAIFDCGHSFHLSCVISNPYSSLCSACGNDSDKLPDLGLDRQVAIRSNTCSKIQQRQLKPNEVPSFMGRVQRLLSPLTPQATCFSDHVFHNKKLSFISRAGFEPNDAVQERIKWSKLAAQYESTALLEFGFTWSHMVEMGITPEELAKFTWAQQVRGLTLTAEKILQMKMSITELASLKYTTHQLVELGFTWAVLSSVGANVETWHPFGFKLEDLKRYWHPSLTQWVSSGFYDKDRLQHAGWEMDDVLKTLPNVNSRNSGRMLRLEF